MTLISSSLPAFLSKEAASLPANSTVAPPFLSTARRVALFLLALFLLLPGKTWAQSGNWTSYTSVPEEYAADASATTINIDNAAELAWVAKLVNAGTTQFQGVTLTLTADIAFCKTMNCIAQSLAHIRDDW